MKKKLWLSPFLAAAALVAGTAIAHPEAAHVEVEGEWVRATVPGQQGTGGFMRLKAKEALTLVGVRSPAAKVAELHEMKMEGDVMRMRAIKTLKLPAGQTVELKPGGHHLMLQELKAPLPSGSEVPLTLEFKDAKGELSRLHLRLPVATSAPEEASIAHPEAAHVEVEGEWVRATVPGQQGTGGFMRLKAKEALTLVGVRSPAAKVAELHEMKMEGDVMRMRAIETLKLPAGQTVELKPGGHHLMLQELKAPLPSGSEVPLTLEFKDAKGELSRLHLRLPVATSAPAGASPAAAHGHGGHAH